MTTTEDLRRAHPGEGPPARHLPTQPPTAQQEGAAQPGAPVPTAAAPASRDRRDEGSWSEHVGRLEVDDLRRLALALPVIEQAKGVLMGHYGCDAEAAFGLLRRMSSTRNTKLRLVAADVVAAASRPHRERPGPLIPIFGAHDQIDTQ